MSKTASPQTASTEEGTVTQAQAAEPHSETDPARTSAEELLAIPPRADDLAEELATRPPRAKLPKLTLVLGGAVLVAAGFLGGALAQKHFGSGGTSNRAAFASGFSRGGAGTGTGATGRTGGGFGGGGFGGGFGGGGNAISGTVTVVSGDTLYVTAANGTVYTVTTTGSTTVKISSSGSLSQLKPGQTVTIAGTADASGNVAATSITAATN